MAVEIQASPDQLAGIGRQPHQAVCRYGFTGAAFAYDPQHFSLSQMNGNIIQRFHFSCRCEKGKPFIFYIYKIF